MVILMLILGLVVLTVEAELLVRGASRLALAMEWSHAPWLLRGVHRVDHHGSHRPQFSSHVRCCDGWHRHSMFVSFFKQ